ncbi:MAG: type IX secretion system membrane protein PorP/SprF, partial [Bacteroidetes bacterium]|nr:type IX secretion system membrane protein PorP/SprF [Bacteroidota bacterium]
ANINSDLNSVRYTDPGDQLLQNPAISALLPEFSIGSYYHTDRYYVGISMPLFLTHPVHEGTGNYRIGFQVSAANYLLSAGYLLRLSEQFELLPSILLKSIPSNNTQLDVHANLIYRERFWIGSSIRTNGCVSTLFQFQINPQLLLGYSYAYEFSELSSYQHGSHEVVIRYNFRYLLNVISPRYF